MKWHETSKKRPPKGEYIWAWDRYEDKKILLKYLDEEEAWIMHKDKKNPRFPIWAYLNDQEEL